jgi:hypothetical protein
MVPAGFVLVTVSANSLCLSPKLFSRLTTIRSLSASSPGFVLVPCVQGRLYEQQRPRAVESSASTPCTVSPRMAAAARTSAAPGVFVFCLLSTAFHSRGRTLPLRGRFQLQPSSGRPHRPTPLRGFWSVRRSGNASRGYSLLLSSSPSSLSSLRSGRSLERSPALVLNSSTALREVRPHNVAYCIHLVSYCKQRWYIVFFMYFYCRQSEETVPSQIPKLVFSSFKSVVSLGFSFHLHRFIYAVRANPVRFRYCVCVTAS